jgi:hypothetical protein
MIKNYNSKLGALALAQESKKGFPKGIPEAARPYMEEMGLADQDILPEEPQMQRQNVQEGMNPMMNVEMAYGGSLQKARVGLDGIDPYGKAKRVEGNSTPTKKSNTFSSRYDDVKTYTNTYAKAIPGINEMSNSEAQGAIYDWNLKNNPEGLTEMWDTFGLTNAGKKNKDLYALTNEGVFNEGVTSDADNLASLKEAYVDGMFGARTIDFNNPEEVAIATKELKTKVTPETSSNKSLPPVPRDPAKPWLQDRLSRGNAFIDYMNVDKALPWAPSVNPEQIDPTFYDPTRELAQQSEEANMITQGLSQFSGPQATSVAASQIQGNAAKNAANTLGKYNNMNVGVANQNEAQNAQIDINAQLANAATAKELYDKNTVANQQYANSKSGLRNNLVQAENNLLSNMWKTDTMNQMYPQYNVNPGNGGEMTYDETKGKQLTGQVTETYDEAIIRHRRKGMTLEEAEDAEEREWKRKNRSSQSGSAESQVLSQYAKEGGSIDSIFEMGTSAFPFYGFY